MTRGSLSRFDASALPSSDIGAVPVRHPLIAFVISLRPDQWTKNLIVFAGLIFGERLFDVAAIGPAVWAFVVFCSLSSGMYLVNDLADREEDRQHPVKSRRPIAAGHLSPTMAWAGAVGLVGGALAGAFRLGWPFGLLALVFAVLLTAYTRTLKHVVLVDVMAIAAGFILRAVGGAVAVDVPISQWLLICTMLLATFLALAKRRHELSLLGRSAADHRQALSEYTRPLLDQLSTVVAAATIIAYALYTTEPATIRNFGTDRLTWTLPFPMYGIFRYLYLVQRQAGGGSPTDLLLRDRHLLVCVALWALVVVALIYRPWPIVH